MLWWVRFPHAPAIQPGRVAMSTLLIINPAAGHGRGARLAPRAITHVRRLWPQTEVARTTEPGSATTIARQGAEAGLETILVLGGDGTVHEVANGILQAEVPSPPAIAALPVGTGNDFARLTGTQGLSVAPALAALEPRRKRHIDVGRAWDEYFVNSLGVALAGEVAYRVNRMERLGGLSAYLLGVLQTMWSYTPMHLTVISDDREVLSEECLALEVGNGSTSGGGFRLTPDARPDDGMLDFCFIRPLGKLALLTKLPRAIRGRHVGLPQVAMGRSSRLTIRAKDQPLRAHFDGEYRSPGSRDITIVTLPGALPVLVTERSILAGVA
jgi:diacylglycerol kinase (ATP)